MSSERTFFHRTDDDRKPPSRVLTGILLGDPDPNREARSAALKAAIEQRSSNRRTNARRKYDF